jgi:hypothetical protein
MQMQCCTKLPVEQWLFRATLQTTLKTNTNGMLHEADTNANGMLHD